MMARITRTCYINEQMLFERQDRMSSLHQRRNYTNIERIYFAHTWRILVLDHSLYLDEFGLNLSNEHVFWKHQWLSINWPKMKLVQL